MSLYTIPTGGVAAYTNQGGCQRKLARKSNGDLWCVYFRSDGIRSQIYVSYSTDGGVTWTEEQVSFDTASPYNGQTNPAIAIDSLDNIHVVWEGLGWCTDPVYSSIQYRQRTTTWQTQVMLSVNNKSALHSSIAIDSLDNVHVIYSAVVSGPPSYGYTQIHYRKKTSGSWGSSEQLTAIAVNQLNSSIAIDSLNNIHVTWPGGGWPGVGSDYVNIQYRKRTTSWQAQEAITNIVKNQFDVCIAIDSLNNVHVVWTGLGSGTNLTIPNIYYRKRTTSWQVQESVSDKNVTQQYPSIAVDSLDNIQVTWVGKGWGIHTSFVNILFRGKTTGGWQVTESLSDLAIDHFYPVLIWASHPIIDGIKTNRTKTGKALVWMEATVIKFYKSSDLTWGGPQIIRFGGFPGLRSETIKFTR